MIDANTIRLMVPGYAAFDLAFMDNIVMPNPAPGSAATYKVTGDWFIYIISALCVITTDATVSNREIRFNRSTQAIAAWEMSAGLTHPASSTFIYTATTGSATPYSSGSQLRNLYIPDDIFFPGDSFLINIFQGGPGDTITNINLNVLKIPVRQEQYERTVQHPTPVTIV